MEDQFKPRTLYPDIEIHIYEKAQSYDFHHSFYFSPGAQEKIEDEESMVFWVDEDGVNGEWTHGSIPANIVTMIYKQISVE